MKEPDVRQQDVLSICGHDPFSIQIQSQMGWHPATGSVSSFGVVGVPTRAKQYSQTRQCAAVLFDMEFDIRLPPSLYRHLTN
jgi:hypothetical protein